MPIRTAAHVAAAAARQSDALTLGTATWLAAGIVVYGLTPLPLRDAALGWSAPFWLLAAPALILALRGYAARWREQGAAPRQARAGQHARARRPAIRRRGVRAAPAAARLGADKSCGYRTARGPRAG